MFVSIARRILCFANEKDLMEAVILAGGLGTRLRGVVDNVPKPMAPVNGRPFLSLILDELRKYNFKKAILAVGYKHRKIVEYFGNTYGSLNLEYVVEDVPRGTGGALLLALAHASEKNVLVLNGDSIFKVNLMSLMKAHNARTCEITLVLKRVASASRYGIVRIDKTSRVTGFQLRGGGGGSLINSGVYIINKELFANNLVEKQFSFEVFLKEECENLKIFGEVKEGEFIDIGIPEDYNKAKSMFL